MRILLLALSVSFLACASAGVQADNRTTTGTVLVPVPVPVVPALCPGLSVPICGTTYNLSPGQVGTWQTVTLPDRYIVNSANYQCIANLNPYYQLVNPKVLDCALKTCDEQNLAVCGAQVSVKGGTALGDAITITMPDGLLDPNHVTLPYQTTARCTQHSDGLHYDFVDGTLPSCNAFLCQPAELTACDARVEIVTPAPLGKMIDALTSTNKPVKIECLGSLEGAPHFSVFQASCE